MRVGMLGCGKICDIYLQNLCVDGADTVIAACADVVAQRARETGEKWKIPAMTPEQLLADDSLDCILLLTPPLTHFQLGMEVLSRGKHLYTEKPMALTQEECQQLTTLARQKNLRIGCAPDTFLGAGIQTVFSAIREGKIGKPLAASAFMLCAGHERWHPNPDFYYQKGGGPILDMGPYALTVLVKLFGPAREVSAMGMRSYPQRTIGSGPRKGETFPVEVDTFLSAQIRFVSGAIASLIYSFDTAPTALPHMEIYGELGTIRVPDPNFFDGPVLLGLKDAEGWSTLPLVPEAPVENARGIGVSDMGRAIREGRDHQADGQTGAAVVAIMEAILQSAADGRPRRIG